MARQLSSLLISRHDYRTRRKANVHFIARELAMLGPTRFFSSSFSWLSRLKGDQRMPLWSQANRVTVQDGVECYLWRTALHPCKCPAAVDTLMDAYFRAYVRQAPRILKGWIEQADVILLESGGPEIFFEFIKGLNPTSRVIYISSDDLQTIGSPRYVQRNLVRNAELFDGIRVPSKALQKAFSPACKLYYVPHGIDAIDMQAGASPYQQPLNAVSVGNMLFDPEAIRQAAAACPDVQFHVIGAGSCAARLSGPNVTVHDEMEFKDTLAYLCHADVGMAPYLEAQIPVYLADTSMKLMQYEYLGLPAVCPESTAAGHGGRFGYRMSAPNSIAQAIRAAMAHGRFSGSRFLSWREVTERILYPETFSDTSIN